MTVVLVVLILLALINTLITALEPHPLSLPLRVATSESGSNTSYQEVMLNEQLLQGFDFTSSLVGVLTRFCQELIAIMADVEAMFHQVKVPQEDSDLLRFLWWSGGNVNEPMVEYNATSSLSCASHGLRRTCLTLQQSAQYCTVST